MRLKNAKAKGDAYERELADWFNNVLPEGIRLSPFRRAVLSGGGVADSGFDLTGTRVRLHHYAPCPDAPPQRFLSRLMDWELGIEAKRVEKINVWEAMKQADGHKANMSSRGLDVSRLVPLVVTRKNGVKTGDSLVIMRLRDFARMLLGCPVEQEASA